MSDPSVPEEFSILFKVAQEVGGARKELQKQMNNTPKTYGQLLAYMMKGVEQSPGGPVETQQIFCDFVDKARREMVGAKQELEKLDDKLDKTAQKLIKIVRDKAVKTLLPRGANSAAPQERPTPTPTRIARMPAGPKRARSATKRPVKCPKKKAENTDPAAGAAGATPAGAEKAAVAAAAQAKEN